MIPYLAPQKNWQNRFSDIITRFEDLAAALELPIAAFERPSQPLNPNVPFNLSPNFNHDNQPTQALSNFPLKVPRQFVAKMQKGDPTDPLLLQILPTFAETVNVTGFVTDPLQENSATPVKGLIHKYASRVLIPVTGACMVHCRYCFRQHFDYSDNTPAQVFFNNAAGKVVEKEADDKKAISEDWQAIGAYITAHPEINEVILSGGDPLSLSDRRLFAILDFIENLSQIRTIRLHTRVPVVIPQRLDTPLLEKLHAHRCQIVMVIHANHPNEIDPNIDPDTLYYLTQARNAGITLLNQTVLLKGINDNADTLAKLSEILWQAGVLPYYLHVLDKVAGAAHFYIDDSEAVAIYWQLLAKCSGYLVPKLVRELPHEPFKTPINLYAIKH